MNECSAGSLNIIFTVTASRFLVSKFGNGGLILFQSQLEGCGSGPVLLIKLNNIFQRSLVHRKVIEHQISACLFIL